MGSGVRRRVLGERVPRELNRAWSSLRKPPSTPSNVLASLYRHLGIDPATTIPDLNKRPMHLLDDREGVRELESA